MILLLLAQLATWDAVRPPVLHAGYWESCSGEERVLEHRVANYLVWELHMGPADEFALYAFPVDGPGHDHSDPLNLLRTPTVDTLTHWDGERQWDVPTLKLHIGAIRAGGTAGCDAFRIEVRSQ